jgi:hypothetical protein
VLTASGFTVGAFVLPALLVVFWSRKTWIRPCLQRITLIWCSNHSWLCHCYLAPLAARVSRRDLKCFRNIPGDDRRFHGWTLPVSALEAKMFNAERHLSDYRLTGEELYRSSLFWRLAAPFRHWEFLIRVGMYMLNPSDTKAVCQTLGIFYRWKYVHVEVPWCIKPPVRHWEYFTADSMGTALAKMS